VDDVPVVDVPVVRVDVPDAVGDGAGVGDGARVVHAARRAERRLLVEVDQLPKRARLLLPGRRHHTCTDSYWCFWYMYNYRYCRVHIHVHVLMLIVH